MNLHTGRHHILVLSTGMRKCRAIKLIIEVVITREDFEVTVLQTTLDLGNICSPQNLYSLLAYSHFSTSAAIMTAFIRKVLDK